MRTRSCQVLLLAVVASACGSPPPPPYRPVADVKALMAFVMEPAADEYWDAVGTIVDAEGEHEIEPQTPEEWEQVKYNAYTFTEAGNLLMMPTRAQDNAEWMRLAQAFIASGEKAIRAAEARDKQAVFDTGAEVYEACTNCHATYALELQQANFRD